MADLFNKQVLQTQLKNHSIPDYEDKLDTIRSWKRNLKSIIGANEERLQASFLKGIFGIVLGYRDMTEADGDGEYTLEIEPSTEVDATKPDGSLGFYHQEEDGSTEAVIELKGPKTSLDKQQKRSGKYYGTPVEQAFGYASKYDGCKWVIVSNMIEIRLYTVIRGQGHYEVFRVDELDQEENFKKFHLLLSRNNLLSKQGKSMTQQLSEETEQQEENISVEFYNLYKETRVELFEHLKENNSDYEEDLLLDKAQKFLDRIIFICFCEDLGLLPAEILHKAIDRGTDSYSFSEVTVWQEIKGVFRAIDTGSEQHNINAYNGGLFKPDEVLDSLVIKNDFFTVIDEISAYDFDSELDVNILGHVFEQSISDIEEIKADIQNDDYDRQESKRKKDGIYYTPEYITKYIVENSVGKYLEDIRRELGENELPDIEEADTPQLEGKYKKKHLEFYHEYEERLKEVKVLDPACGSGAFLNQAFDFLLKEYQWIYEQIDRLQEGQRSIFGLESLHKDILKNNIYGVDINESSVEITKLSLWLKTANKNQPLTNLDDNIKCGNSLIDDPEVAGEKAFDWEDEFPEIMDDGGFDVVVGNPPYVRHEQIKWMKPYLKDNYEVYNGTADLYCYFFERGIELLDEDGYFSFIVSNKFTRAKYGKELREYLLNYQIEEYIDYTDENVFRDATVDPCVIIIKKSVNQDDYLINYNKNHVVPRRSLSVNNWSFMTKKEFNLKEILEEKGDQLEKWNLDIKFGIKTGLNKAFIIDEELKNELISKDQQNEEIIKPLLRGRDIRRYKFNFNNLYLLLTGYDIDIPNEYPHIYEYLKQFKTDAKKRYDQGKNWWNLRGCDYYDDFEEEKIIYRDISDRLMFCYDSENIYFNNTVYFINSGNKYLLAILNSKLINFYYKLISSQLGSGASRGFSIYIKKLPIPKIIQEKQKPFIDKANFMIEGKKKLNQLQQIEFISLINKYTSKSGPQLGDIVEEDGFYNKIYSGRARKVRNMTVTVNDTILTIYADKSSSGQYELMKFEVEDKYQRRYIKYYLENLTDQQLEEANDFSGGLVKRVLQIEIPDYHKYQVVRKVVNEWNDLQQEIADLEEKIEVTDREIDQMVYDLYGLSDEEIQIVEESLADNS
ncbi:Eco57I restriction-modification methylase domain-containing protein [Acetohalobium arabaticum]|uniref:site-specific DNA-methyltransferase (adenine-specific) n=1 Tax=Acetohalobium arabaticum (strain ATCC 49924 / DSM 5501 / Z-7288) TaxID=574087 RepID=D9QV10_ACEAZ|nr:TaqI-like C-terminal specificity domain-containing protein [Acetohalobium arabaticum]ADL12069.1 Eco57I restriction endonuclease [Acetohalobium arabaticum DSM 5501]